MKKKIGIAAVVLAAILAAFAVYAYRSRHENKPVEATLTRQKVYLIGLDGASWNLMKGPLAEGKLPHFQQLIQAGTSGSLKSFVPTKSPILWTSIATGKTQLKHGIGNFVAEKDGKMIPVSGGQRITKAFWNIFTDYGIRVGVVNWWVTWPPEQVNGFMVSDRYRNGNPKKLENYVLTYPPELLNELPKVGISKDKYLEERAKYGLPKEEHPEVESSNIEKMTTGYKTYWSQDKAVWESCRRLLAKKNVDVFAVVFRIIDVSSHLFWTYLDFDMIEEMRTKLAEGKLTQEDIDHIDAEYSKIIGPIYAYADQILADFLKSADENTTIIICSDHGFKFEEGRYGHSSMKVPPDGIVILKGPAFKKNYKIQGATLLDIAPTLLYLEGIPMGRDMDGKVLFQAFEPQYVKKNAPTVIASHDKGFKQKGEPLSSGQDEEILDDLRSLGYIN